MVLLPRDLTPDPLEVLPADDQDTPARGCVLNLTRKLKRIICWLLLTHDMECLSGRTENDGYIWIYTYRCRRCGTTREIQL